MAISTHPTGDKKSSKRKYLVIALSIFALLSLIFLLSNPGGARSSDLDDDDEKNEDDLPEDVAEIVPVSSTESIDNSTTTAAIEDNNAANSSSDISESGQSANGEQDGEEDRVSTSRRGGGGGGGSGGGSGSSNDAPISKSQSMTTNEDTSISINLQSDDQENDKLTYIITQQPSHGTALSFDSSQGSLIYSPNPNYSGSDTFKFKAKDSADESNIATVTIIVLQINDAPLSYNQSVSTNEDVSISSSLNYTDADPSDILSFVITNPPIHGSLTGSAPNLIYSPNANYNGPDSFMFKVNDGFVDSNEAAVSIWINSVDDAPVAANITSTTQEDTSTSLVTVTESSDVDGDVHALQITRSPLHGIVTIIDGNVLVYTPNQDFNGGDVFEYTISDSAANSTGIVTVTVISVNDPPIVVAENFNATTNEDTSVLIEIISNVFDVDGDALSLETAQPPFHGSVTINNENGTLTYTPEQNYSGQDSFQYAVSDGNGGYAEGWIIVTVNPINDAPVANNQTLTIDEDVDVDVTLSAIDVDGNSSSITFEILIHPSHGTLSPFHEDNATLTYTPSADFNGNDIFTFQASDGTLGSNIASVTIQVDPVNDNPYMIDGVLDSITVDEDSSVDIDILSNVIDPDGDSVAIADLSQPPSNGVVIINEDGTVTYTPNSDYDGNDSFEVSISDSNGGSTIASVIVTINSINDVPMIQDQVTTTDEDTPVEILLSVTDADADDTFTYTIIAQPSHSSIISIASDGTVTYTPFLNYHGPDDFTYQVSDGFEDSDIAAVSIQVEPVNDDPIASNDNYATSEDNSITLNVLDDDTDVDGDILEIQDIEQPSHGNATITGGQTTIDYSPDADFTGVDSFGYTISDGNGGTATAIVTVTVGAVNDSPNAEDQSLDANEDTLLEVMLVATDPDEDALTFSLISLPFHGILESFDENTGTASYSPDSNYNGDDSFTFQVSDGLEDSSVATVSITILPVNDPPIANDDIIVLSEDSSISNNVLLNDWDIENDNIALVLTEGANVSTGHGSVLINTNGDFTYTPEPDYNGPDSFNYTASDGNDGNDTAIVTINVIAVNDSPVANDDFAFTTLEAPVLIRVLDNDSDIDDEELFVGSFDGSIEHGTVSITSDGKAIIYSPDTEFAGIESFTYTVTDGSASATGTVTVEVYNSIFGHLQPPVGGAGNHEFEQGSTANVRFKLTDADGNDISNAIVILRVQQLDSTNNPIGPIMDATSAGGSNEGNLFKYSESFYQYNLKTDDLDIGKWALYVYLIDDTQSPTREILMEDAPIDGISSTIFIK